MGALHYYCLLLLALFRREVWGIAITSVRVPATARSGDRLQLFCHFTLAAGDHLYSLSWWRDSHLFYAYYPSHRPQQRVYDHPGIIVDRAASTLKEVVLARVDQRASGTLRCEVLADTPTFEYDASEANLTVIALPEDGPNIDGLSELYSAGSLLKAVCSFPPAFPPVTLTWTLNGRQTGSEETVVAYPDVWDEERLAASTSTLSVLLQPHHLRRGLILLSCTATVRGSFTAIAKVFILDASFWVKKCPAAAAAIVNNGQSVRADWSVVVLPPPLLLLLLSLAAC